MTFVCVRVCVWRASLHDSKQVRIMLASRGDGKSHTQQVSRLHTASIIPSQYHAMRQQLMA
jgi:hypothetical protein